MNEGHYIIVNDRPAVRFEHEFAYPIPRVWQAVVDRSEARQWFPSTLVFEPVPRTDTSCAAREGQAAANQRR